MVSCFYNNDKTALKGVTTSQDKAVVPIKTPGGNEYYSRVTCNDTSLSIMTSIGESYAGIAVGSGDTPATEDDYTIESLITALTGSVASSIYYDATNFRYVSRYQITLNNATESDIVVKEVAKFVNAYTSTTRGATTTSNMKSIMIDRTVLDTPVTVAAGESALINYDFLLPSGEIAQ